MISISSNSMVTFFIAILFGLSISSAMGQHIEYEKPRVAYETEVNRFKQAEISVAGTAGDKAKSFFKNSNYHRGNPVKNNSETLLIYPNKQVGLLQYHFKKDVMKVFLVTSEGLIYGSKLEISTEKISNLNREILVHLGVENDRGAHALIRKDYASGTLNNSVTKLTEILFPHSLTQKLLSLDHLIILGEEVISQIPFSLLQPFNKNTYLIDHLSYTNAPNLSTINKLSKQQSKRSYQLNSNTTKATIIGNPESDQFDLAPLPGAEDEASMIHERYGGELFLGKEATSTNFVHSLPDKDFLYLACHGIVNYDDPINESYLVLSPDLHDDGLLSAKEIASLSLDNVKIAVLSACQTGVGKSRRAGFVGVGRSFYTAGVLNTLMTLWSIDDKATVDFMKIFMKHLEDTDTYYPAENLQRAMIEFKEIYPDPKYWAPFTFLGFSKYGG